MEILFRHSSFLFASYFLFQDANLRIIFQHYMFDQFYFILQVSYVKAIDWYLICCFLFVFGVLVEYTIVLYLENVGQRKKKKKELQKKLDKEAKAKVAVLLKLRINYQ